MIINGQLIGILLRRKNTLLFAIKQRKNLSLTGLVCLSGATVKSLVLALGYNFAQA